MITKTGNKLMSLRRCVQEFSPHRALQAFKAELYLCIDVDVESCEK